MMAVAAMAMSAAPAERVAQDGARQTSATGKSSGGLASKAAAQDAAIRRLFGGQGILRPFRYPKHTGWTNASYRRAAAKRRRVLANRRAHRG
jgi:hypothetical protein